MDVFETMAEMRAMRRLKPDPIPRADIEEIIRYATHAPSGSNAQGWRFIVVTEAEKKRQIGDLYNDTVKNYLDRYNTEPQPHQSDVIGSRSMLQCAGRASTFTRRQQSSSRACGTRGVA